MGTLILFVIIIIALIGSMAALISTGNTSMLIILIPCAILMIILTAFGINDLRNDKTKKKQEEKNWENAVLGKRKEPTDDYLFHNKNPNNPKQDKKEHIISLEPFDMMTGFQFKDLIERHFKSSGYKVNRISPRINSIDFLIEKECKTIAIATKKTFDLVQMSYINNVIESAKMYENISSIMIITTSMFFMPRARQLAEENGIILWDRYTLIEKLEEINENETIYYKNR